MVTFQLPPIYISELAGLNLRNLLRFWCTGDVLPANPNPPEVTNNETRHSHLRPYRYRCRSRRRRHHAQERSAHRQPPVGHRQYAGPWMRTLHVPPQPRFGPVVAGYGRRI